MGVSLSSQLTPLYGPYTPGFMEVAKQGLGGGYLWGCFSA